MKHTRDSIRRALKDRQGPELGQFLGELAKTDKEAAAVLSQGLDLGDEKQVRRELSRFESRLSHVVDAMDKTNHPEDHASPIAAHAAMLEDDADPRRSYGYTTYLHDKERAMESILAGGKDTPTLVVGDSNLHEGTLVESFQGRGYTIEFQRVGPVHSHTTVGRRDPAKAAEHGETLGVRKSPDSRKGDYSYHAPLVHYPEIDRFLKKKRSITGG